MTVCYDPDHFYLDDAGTLTPQPWMQHRLVATAEAAGREADFTVTNPAGAGFLQGVPLLGTIFGGLGLGDLTGILTDVTGGLGMFNLGNFGIGGILGVGAAGSGNKNEFIHAAETGWINDTPIPHWVYGLVTRGGCRVTLQARSRAYLALWTGLAIGGAPGDLVLASAMGCGADLGRAGILAVGTGFCILEQRQNSVTIPLAPERADWLYVEPGQAVTGRAELRFVSDVWEAGMVDGGDQETESGYASGDTRVDLFAIPDIGLDYYGA